MSSYNEATAKTEPSGNKPLGIAPGQVIDSRYVVEGPLGEGGMGVVCRGKHLGLGTAVAIKLMRPDLKQDHECVQRFLNEARRAAALRSERIARVHDVGQLASGEPYLVMELLEGQELDRYVQAQGPLSQADAVSIVLQICEGLAEAHAGGVVHRDVKPSNVFLARRSDGQFGVKLLDFGISKQLVEPDPGLTGADESLGSPWYMSPEQMLDPSRVDERSDIWSVGVVLFELLTGERPFEAANIPEVCAKVLTASPLPLARLRPDLDPELVAVVDRCLEKRPEHRFHTVVELGAALQRFNTPQRISRITPTDFFSAEVEEMPRSNDVVELPSSDLESLPPSAPRFSSTSQRWYASTPPEATPLYDSTAPLLGDSVPATPTLRRRVRRAHVLGVLGVAAVIGLLALAVVRGREDPTLLASSGVKQAAETLPSKGERLVQRVFGASAAPELRAGPPASELDHPPKTMPFAFAATAPVHDVPIDASADAESEAGPAEAGAAPVLESTQPLASTAAQPSSSETLRSERTPAAPAAISPEEVRSRLENYERWLREQGLTRLDEKGDTPAYMNEP